MTQSVNIIGDESDMFSRGNVASFKAESKVSRVETALKSIRSPQT